MARGDDSLLVPNLRQAPPENFPDPQARSYSSFIASPVRTTYRSFGLITVDSTKPNSLTIVDVGYIQLLAGLLAAGLAQLDEDELAEALRTSETAATRSAP